MDNDKPELGTGRQQPTENCVEYYLFIIGQQLDNRLHIQELEALRKAATQLCQSLTATYIWQRDEFHLELKIEQDYGDSVEDEWLIVYVLRELTRSFPRLWVRIADTDGEFLLIEAAKVLPSWISPGIDQNRVWVHDSKLHIIPPSPKDHHLQNENSRSITLRDAVEYIRTKPNALVQSPPVETEAFYRLQKYPHFIEYSSHYTLLTIPRKLAYILHTLPKSIAMAVEMFYLRDPIDMEPIVSASSSLMFPPEDLVTISIQFSKVLFAQLKSQRFEPPPRWQLLFSNLPQTCSSSINRASSSQLELGMKLTCGYEMLATNADKSKHRVVREVDILLQDLIEDGDDALPTNQEMESWPNHQRSDNENWMEIDFGNFERELGGQRSVVKEKPSGFGDAQVQADLRKIVTRFEAFLDDDKAGLDGANLDEMDDDDDADADESDEDCEPEDSTVNFDDEAFARIMNDFMGPRQTGTEIMESERLMKTNQTPLTGSEEPKDELDELQHLAGLLEAELKQHGALDLKPDEDSQRQGLDRMHSQDEARPPTSSLATEDADIGVNIDYNLARNILESFKSQGGMAGPASNLLGMMGFTLPRDEDE
ncbi:hypothetical protein QQS21_001868 [Conoideocrella luteorostrata]|uniref:SGT1-domain-containing protein n=1 Tax=Conoideocrella luteorostrata TaxID=1105319 RepID=A0AAJ0CX63_9HYPO|nr:hypothetical protein QQS21_001868 [Conoideocrella luteorostrata]